MGAKKLPSYHVVARVSSAALFRKLIESISDLATDVNLDFTQAGVSVSAMDSSHVSLFDFLLPTSQMEQYSVKQEQSVGINVHNMLKVFRCAGSDDSVELRIAETTPCDELQVMFESSSGNKSQSFELKLLDLEVDRLETPEMIYDAVLTTASYELQRLFKNLSSIGDTVQISAAAGKIEFVTAGDVGRARVSLVDSQTTEGVTTTSVVTVDAGTKVSNTFALRYMNSFAKATPLSTKVTVSLTEGMPVRVRYSLDDGDGHVQFYLAPKINEDEENMET
jgi:proliferating cell nuclear antigen